MATKAQKRSALKATRYESMLWGGVWFRDLPHHVRVLQRGDVPAVVSGIGGRRKRKARRAEERAISRRWQRERARIGLSDEEVDDLPY